RQTARALHRALPRAPAYRGVRLLGLYSEVGVAAELRQSAGVLPRLAPDAELRAALQGEGTTAEAPAAADPDPASVASAPAGPLAVPAIPAPAVPATPSTTAQAMPTTFPASTGPAIAGTAEPLPRAAAPAVPVASTAPAAPAVPAAPVAPPAPTAPATPGAAPRAGTPLIGGRAPRLLLVEDNPVNLLVAQKLLSVLGYTCDTATNGELALQRLSASEYDMVFMDCQMPVLDGYTATRRWREHEASRGGRRLPIVAMTANVMAGDRQRCLDAGMDDYLSKPVAREQLEACLQRWLQQAAAEAAAAQARAAAPAPAPSPAPAAPVAPAAPAAPVPASHAAAMPPRQSAAAAIPSAAVSAIPAQAVP